MPARALTSLSVPPGPAGVGATLVALRSALGGGPAVAPVPAPSPAVPAAYAARVAAALRADDPRAPLEDERVAVVCATSGSTGDPRGVLLTSDAIGSAVDGLHRRLGGPGRWVAAIPVHHVGGLMVLARSVASGLDPVADPSTGGAAPFDPLVFAATTRAARASSDADGAPLYVSLVPTQLARLMASPGGPESLACYDAVLSGAAATPSALLDELRAAGVRVLASYGMSETCGGCVYDGEPLDGVVLVIDTATTHGAGRVSVGGGSVALGYRLRPDLTRATFVDGRVLTGDTGYVDSVGRLHVLGRVDDVVQVGGTSVALSAVEEVLRGEREVAEAVAVALPDPEWGAAVHAVVVTSGGGAGAALADDLRERVALVLGRAARPRAVHRVDALPLLPTGKVDREAVRRLAGGS